LLCWQKAVLPGQFLHTLTSARLAHTDKQTNLHENGKTFMSDS
jgi:hypothetical protein